MLIFHKKVNVTLRNLPELGLKWAYSWSKIGILLSKLSPNFVQKNQNQGKPFKMGKIHSKTSSTVFSTDIIHFSTHLEGF